MKQPECYLLLLVFCITGCGGQERGQGTVIEDFIGQPLVINYWAEWCAPCREEIPALNRFQQANPGIKVLGVNFDGATGEDLAAQEKALGITFPTLAQDPRQRWQLAPVEVLPQTLLVNEEGKLLKVLEGSQTEVSLQQAWQQLPLAQGDAGE